jgi:hypothetical protein
VARLYSDDREGDRRFRYQPQSRRINSHDQLKRSAARSFVYLERIYDVLGNHQRMGWDLELLSAPSRSVEPPA